MGDARLLRMSRPVEDLEGSALRSLLQDMKDTMHAAQGVGLAAPQIGVDLRVVIFGGAPSQRYPEAPEVPYTELVNPVVTLLGDRTEEGWEGCLSVPGMRGLVPRFLRLRYSGLTPQGGRIERIAEGFHARVVQHECDHLDGILYPMRMHDMSQFGFADVMFPGSADD